jgi:hypothetical protein
MGANLDAGSYNNELDFTSAGTMEILFSIAFITKNIMLMISKNLLVPNAAPSNLLRVPSDALFTTLFKNLPKKYTPIKMQKNVMQNAIISMYWLVELKLLRIKLPVHPENFTAPHIPKNSAAILAASITNPLVMPL